MTTTAAPRSAWTIVRENPIPFVALAGLLAGLVARWGLEDVELGRRIWWVTLLIGGTPVAIETVRGMLRGRFASDIVALLAILAALYMNEGFSGLVIVLMQSGGEALERYSLRRASSAFDELLARAPRRATRKRDGNLEEIPAEGVHVGDLLLVRPGELIPVDGTLASESALINESAVTGEPLAGTKAAGSKLLSGSLNAGDAFEFRADRPSGESQYARIVQLVRQAQEQKPPLQRLADRYAVWFTPLTLFMCGLGWWITGESRTILSVLVVATPCPLILAVPVAVIGGINRAARAGIIVKGGAAIEQVGHARAIVFDKTGTLTFGAPVVDRVIAFDGFSEQDVLRHAGGLEQLSTHLLGQTLTTEARSRLGHVSMPEGFREIAGRGVEGTLDGQLVRVGSARFLRESIGADVRKPEGAEPGMAAFVAVGDRAAGVVTFKDRMRPGVPELIRDLHAMGVARTVMLTGDHDDHALAIGREAGLDAIEANLLPEDKVTRLQAIRKEYDPIVMVGDGINDAPALAAATVGIAMGAKGTGISAEAADIVLLVDDVGKVGETVAISRRMRSIALQSIYAGLGLSLACMVVAAFGYIEPPYGALIQEAIDVAVILNALRAR